MSSSASRPRTGSKTTRARAKAPARPLSFALDRFAAAIGRRAAPYGRGELLEILAEAFGHRNSHETTALVAAGALAPEPLEAVGSVVLADGTYLVVGRDARGRALGVDPRAIREGRYAPSPHGGIVDLAPLVDGIGEVPQTGNWHVAEVSGGSRRLELVVADDRDALEEKVALLLADGLLDDPSSLTGASSPDGAFDAKRVIAAYCAQERCAVTYHAPASLRREPDAARPTPFVEGRPETVHMVSVTYRNGSDGPGFVARTREELHARLADWCVETYDLDPDLGAEAILAWHARERPEDLLTYATGAVDLAPAAPTRAAPPAREGDAGKVHVLAIADGNGIGFEQAPTAEALRKRLAEHARERWDDVDAEGDEADLDDEAVIEEYFLKSDDTYEETVVSVGPEAPAASETGAPRRTDASTREDLSPAALAVRYADDREHPDHPRSDWRYLVADGDTMLGYWEWLSHELGIEQDAAHA